MGTFTIGTAPTATPTTIPAPPEQIEIYADTGGECFRIEKLDPQSCMEVSTFDEECFFINHPSVYDQNGGLIGIGENPQILIEDLPIIFSGVHTQGTKLLILESNTTIHSYIMSFDKISNKIWASGKSTHTLTGVTTPIVKDIYSQNNIYSNAEVLIGNTRAEHGVYGHWVDTLIFSALTGVVDGVSCKGEIGEWRFLVDGTNPTCDSYVIDVHPSGASYLNIYNFFFNSDWIRHLDDPYYQKCLGTKTIYEYQGVYYWDYTEFPVQPTIDTALEYHIVTAETFYFASHNNTLIAGIGWEKDEVGNERRVCIEVGGDLGYQTYKHWQKKFQDGVGDALVTLTYEYTGWRTQKRVVFDNATNFVPDNAVMWYVSDTHLAFVGTVIRPNDDEVYGLHYYNYSSIADGRSVDSLKFISLDDHLDNGQFIAQDATLYQNVLIWSKQEVIAFDTISTLETIRLV